MSNLLDEWQVQDRLESQQWAATPASRVELTKPESVQPIVALTASAFKASVARVKDVFSEVGYDLDAVRNGEASVPRITYASFPHDEERKNLFLGVMLPFVLEANNHVRQQRIRIERLREAMKHVEDIGEEDAEWLQGMFTEYNVDPGNFTLLLRRVDTVPPSLALAQSAIESGWGTSRFAREGNAAFGQWTTAEYEGIVPENREEGKDHKIRAFEDVRESVESYIRNLNTHRAYKDFRMLRAKQRDTMGTIDSIVLASALTRYSEKGSEYVSLLRQIISGNKLRALDRAQLGNTVVALRPDA
jgi:Bax protein